MTTNRRGTRKRRHDATASHYGPKAGEKVERAMHELKAGTLRSGRTGKRVTNPKQAIAIGLSEARKAGGKVPTRARKRPAKRRAKRARKHA